MKCYEKEAQKLLRQLGANGSYVGFRYTIFGILQAIKNPELIVYVCKGLYLEIAIHFNVSISSVERDIRTIVNAIWKYGDRDLLNCIFGRELNDKPKNALFVDAMAQYLIESFSDEDEN
jgi:two-component system response regulator (stage 0 sporulation protein A)